MQRLFYLASTLNSTALHCLHLLNESLTAVARYLKENPKITLVIRGYSDPMDSESYNKALALRRAKAVKKH